METIAKPRPHQKPVMILQPDLFASIDNNLWKDVRGEDGERKGNGESFIIYETSLHIIHITFQTLFKKDIFSPFFYHYHLQNCLLTRSIKSHALVETNNIPILFQDLQNSANDCSLMNATNKKTFRVHMKSETSMNKIG